jgi:hypothetical protein
MLSAVSSSELSMNSAKGRKLLPLVNGSLPEYLVQLLENE